MMKFFHNIFIWYFPPTCLFLFLAFGTYEIFSDRVIATAHPLSVIPSPAIPGKPASTLYQGTERGTCYGVIHRWVIDAKGVVYTLEDRSAYHGDGNPKKIFTFSEPFPMVPPDMSAGTAEFHADASRWCNGFQQYIYPVEDNYTIKFEVGRGK